MSFVCGECGEQVDRAGYCARDGHPVVETDDALVGTHVGRYRIARLLAEGGMGRVYLGIQPTIGSRVAIKVLTEHSKSSELLERFFAEARAVNLIRHENIVSVIDMAKLDDGRPYIVMEYIQGQTLASFVRAGGASLGGVVQVMLEVLSALAAAHAIGIVHRDLKPDNVLVTIEGHAKVLDFGIAKLLPGLSQQLSPRTRTGALLGTPAYMAPEQISGSGNIDPRTDIYAAGIVLFEAVTGRVPFVAETLFDLMRMHLEVAPQSPRALRSDLPVSFEQVILTALSKDPGQRFHSAVAMAQALQHASTELRPDDWRALSSRGGMITGGRATATAMPGLVMRGAASERVAPIESPRPAVRGDGGDGGTRARAPTHDAGFDSARPQLGSTRGREAAAEATRPAMDRSRRSNLPWIVGIVAAAAVAVLVTLLVVDRGSGARAPADAAPVVAVGGSADAPGESPAPSGPPAGSATAEVPPDARSARPPAPSHAGSAPTVEVGPGVTVGDDASVLTAAQITIPPHTTHISIPADYDPTHFDPVAYLPKALALAQRLAPDAKLTSFEFDPVGSDGRVDLTRHGRDHEYDFRSEVRSKRPANVPRNLPVDRPCRIHVEVGTRAVTAEILFDEDCDAKLVRHPRCHFAAVWKLALAAGTPSDFVARIGWLSDEKWFFDTDPGNTGTGGVSTYGDSCK